jgi:assimilatory nitrate reductase catalytic subunit
MTRSGKSPRLAAHSPEPFVEVNPIDAEAHRLRDSEFARIATPLGECVLKVVVSGGQPPGSLFAPIHWSDEVASAARIGELVAPETDPHSGQPETKATPAAVAPVEFLSRGFVLSSRAVVFPQGTWWARRAVAGGFGYFLASNDAPNIWQATAQRIFAGSAELLEYVEEARGMYRIAALSDGRLDGALFIGPAQAAPSWDAVRMLFEGEKVEEHQRRLLLSGKSGDGLAAVGPVVCACFGIGLAAIRGAITSGAANVDEIGKALRAGTNCGSCLPELKRIIANERIAQPV